MFFKVHDICIYNFKNQYFELENYIKIIILIYFILKHIRKSNYNFWKFLKGIYQIMK